MPDHAPDHAPDQPTTSLPPRVLFGAAYYLEYQRTPRLEEDLDLMVEAGFSVIRVGESVWSTWEPEESPASRSGWSRA